MAVIDINAKFVAATGNDNDSKKKMVYTADSLARYVVNISENIGELMGFDDYLGTSVEVEVPKSLKMRYVNFADASGKVKGSYPVGKPTEEIYTQGGTITVARKGKADGVVCAVTGAVGEKRALLSANDTGQASGDIT